MDDSIMNLWHPLAAVAEVAPRVVHTSMLLDQLLSFTTTSAGEPVAWRSHPSCPAGSMIDPSSVPDPLPTQSQYGYVWTTLGSAPQQLFEIGEFHEPDRRNLNGASIGVHCSAPRAVENFLDMGHFPFVHTGFLGEQPHTEVIEYNVTIDPITNEIWARDCFFYQPMAAATSSGGQMVEYVYRVPHPYCAILYKSCPADESRMDVIGLFVQPLTEEHVSAHMFLSYLDDDNSVAVIRRFTQTIFAQDKPILENQYPRRLPLDPRAETPVRADKMAVAYRRWLTELGVTYGVIPATARA